MKIIVKEKWWCVLKKPYYSNEKAGRDGEIVGEGRYGETWRVKWRGIKSIYSYPKAYIKQVK
jgi:hypothetical protein